MVVKKRTLKDIPNVARGWGAEYWVENCDDYCGKILVVNPASKGSMHFHMKKKETMYVNYGVMNLRTIDPKTGKEEILQLKENECVLIERGTMHQICNALSDRDLVITEFSTKHEEEDSYRIRKGD